MANVSPNKRLWVHIEKQASRLFQRYDRAYHPGSQIYKPVDKPKKISGSFPMTYYGIGCI